MAGFTAAITSVPDTLPFAQKVTFTNSSTDAFLYKWNFGDGTDQVADKNPLHIYSKAGTYTVNLTSVGSAGSNQLSKSITVSDACSNDTFSKLTSCGKQTWTWSSAADAIKVLSPDGSQVNFSGPAASCQIDDKFSFSADGTFNYNANGETFSVQAGYSCQPAITNATSFKLAAKTGTIPKIVLGNVQGGGKPFIGTTDEVKDNAYQIMNITEDAMTLRGTLADNSLIEFKFKLPSDLDNVKLLLTGGTTRSWKLDKNKVPGAITVGPNDSDPTGYYGGGPLDPCQVDDVYTFGQDNSIVYNAGPGTFVAGGVGCQAPRDYTTNYTFTNVAAGAGIGQINLSGSQYFIGVTDRPSENVYRILEIDDNHMVLRAGNGTSGVVFDLYFVRAN
nr:PKD domain-containing protein [Pedobacter segetis]